MNKLKAGIFLLCLLLLPSLVAADLLLSKPTVGREISSVVEVGSSPEINIEYRNDTGNEYDIRTIDIYLTYDPGIIDNIIGIMSLKPDDFQVTAYDIYSRGRVHYRLTAPANKVRVKQGKTVELATIVFHVTQTTSPQAKVRLFDWSDSATAQSKVLGQKFDLTGKLFDPPRVRIERSAAPEFRGLSQVTSANMVGETNPGNTLVLDWRTPAGAFDRTRFYDGKLSFRIFRRTEDSDWQEISGNQPNPDPRADPYDRFPYTGNTNLDFTFEDTDLDDLRTYFYKVTAIDDASPWPNEKTETAIISGVPLDLKPPGDVYDLSSTIGDRVVSLKWKNPKDLDLGGVLIMKNEEQPVGSGSLGGATAFGDGPEYQVGDQPFGSGNGMVIYISPQEDQNPLSVPTQFDDFYARNGIKSYYKVFTYDRMTQQEMGRNYSKGVEASNTAGIAPRPISEFKAEVGEYPGEILLYWKNSPDNFMGGTLIRYSTDDSAQFAMLKDERSGNYLSDFPVYGAPGEIDGYFVAGFEPDKTYYFKAFAHNSIDEEFDQSNLDQHEFSLGEIASVYLPRMAEEEIGAGPAPGTVEHEPKPAMNIWFGNRLYAAGLAAAAGEFLIPADPRIRVEITIPEPYQLEQQAASYYFVLDNTRTYAFQTKNITANKAILEIVMEKPLEPGKHTFSFNASSAGTVAQSSAIARTAFVTVAGGELKIMDRPLSYPAPFNPMVHDKITFQYTLSSAPPGGVEIMIINVDGRLVKKIFIPPGQDGALAQLNKVSWDGMTEQGTKVSSGLYLVNIMSSGDKEPLGKLKFTVYR